MEEKKEPMLVGNEWRRRLWLQASYAKSESLDFAIVALGRQLFSIKHEVESADVSGLDHYLFSARDDALGFGHQGVFAGGAVVYLDRDPGFLTGENDDRKSAGFVYGYDFVGVGGGGLEGARCGRLRRCGRY